MAHYAFLDDNNVVTEVIVGRHEWEEVGGISDWEEYYGQIHGQRCLRTSYNGNIRGCYAGIGYTYDESRDAFIAPQPYPSWVLNDDHRWQAPIPMPLDGVWFWCEECGKWLESSPAIVDEHAD